MYGGIETGGTKFVCTVPEDGEIPEKTSIPTTTSEETLDQVFESFDCYELDGIGVGSLGPIGVDQTKDNCGYILVTSKKGRAQFDLLGTIRKRYNVPAAWTTGVDAAAYGELKQGTTQGKNSRIYPTVGTGIGAGVVINEEISSGIAYPETGYTWVKRHPDDQYEGTCSYHKGCLEGLAVGPSIGAHIGIKGQDLPQNHPIWDTQAFYIVQALISYTLTLAPEKIILSGGVVNQGHLLRKIRQQFVELTGGYVETPQVSEHIVRWGLPNESEIIGSLLLAEHEHQK